MDHSKEFLALVEEARPGIVEVDNREVARRMAAGEPLRLVDVREDDEWRTGHVRGAEHIGKGVIERDIVGRAPDKTAELVLYCGGGYRSILAARALTKMGYTRVRSMVGGWKGWVAAGLPTETGGEGR